ncbi:cript family protein [Plectosphaerella plurivora]|uniref:Cysteine-rich PDZ-binding protein n=1 Tax=Plectosphaerella plurivora TaxID=936078 RepID=A0A9P8VB51_9PEZI|nr:cript family protein [Plectosphaerella plurivora]
MVCTKCQKLGRGGTTLATPSVKKKSEIYHGSPASGSGGIKTATTGGATKSATLGQTGIGKSKLLSKAAKNPYAAYASACGKCKKSVAQGHAFCHACAYRDNVCAACGKKEKKAKGASVIEVQKFSMK